MRRSAKPHRASAGGPIKTFPLRGIKVSPACLHDNRLRTLADAVDLFNLVLGVKLSEEEKAHVIAFLGALCWRWGGPK